MKQFESINLELTTKCPLRCPQCYCSLEGGIDLPKETALRVIREAAEMGAKHVELSGGETLCYPWLLDLVAEARRNGIVPNIAISGWHFDRHIMAQLIKAGIGGVFVSVNAPTAEQNALTRDGFELAIHSLEVLAESGFKDTYINWVMHRETASTLPGMIELVQPYHPRGIVIMTPKPDAAHTLRSLPTAEQMEAVIQIIRQNKSEVDLLIESCFSPLLALRGKSRIWGNLNRGISKGCSAGLLSVSVNVEGQFSPCRHLEYFESFDSLKEYWEKSEILNKIRNLKEQTSSHCLQCEFCDFCRPCLATNVKLQDVLSIGNEYCPLGEKYSKSV